MFEERRGVKITNFEGLFYKLVASDPKVYGPLKCNLHMGIDGEYDYVYNGEGFNLSHKGIVKAYRNGEEIKDINIIRPLLEGLIRAEIAGLRVFGWEIEERL